MRFQAEQYLANRQRQTAQPLRLYGLVDGLLHGEFLPEQGLHRSTSCAALFDGTPDAALADAGAWLFDCSANSGAHIAPLDRLGHGTGGCSWIISTQGIDELAGALRARLNVTMPNGACALLRYYDARIAADIAAVLSPGQRVAFFAPALEWLAQCNGQFVRIHPTHET